MGKSTVTTKSLREKTGNFLWQILPPLLFFLAIALFFPIGDFQVESDEGVNLAKAIALENGHELYSDIWSDQPPVLTYILAAVIRVFGYQVTLSRLIIIFFAALLYWAFFQILYTHLGKGPALIGSIILFLSNPFTRLSYPIMVGLPAIALACVSLYALMAWHRTEKRAWLLLSAVVLGLSVMTKLFTGLLAPVFAIGLVVWEYRKAGSLKNWRSLLSPAWVWGLGFAVSAGLIVLVWVGFENISQLIDPHVSASNLEQFQNHRLSVSPPLLFLAAAGIFLAVQQRKWILIYPIGWFLASYAFLSTHSPVWDHQSLLVTVPAILLAAYAAFEGIKFAYEFIRGQVSRQEFSLRAFALPLAFVGVLFYLSAFQIPGFVDAMETPNLSELAEVSIGKGQKAILDTVVAYKEETQWMLTDLPMYAYRAGVPIIPETAVMTRKRVFTGNLSEERIIQAIRDYRPEQVLLGGLSYPLVEEFLLEDYDVFLFSGDRTKLYIMRDLLE